MDDKNKRGFISLAQKEAMVEYLKKHPNLISGKFTNTFTFKHATGLWMDLTNMVNSIPGCRKDWKSWRKTWQDIRSRTKLKKSKNKNYSCGTGGGPFLEDPLSKIEEDVKTFNIAEQVENDENKENNDIATDNNLILVVENEQDVNESKVEHQNTPNTPRKIPKRRKKTLQNQNPSIAVEMFRETYSKKINDNEKYKTQKLMLLERIANAKERSASAKEKMVVALENIAEQLHELI